jgi:hypothetical protein
VRRRIFGPKGDEVTMEWRKQKTRSLMICTSQQIEKHEMGEACSMCGEEKREERCIQEFY